MLIVSTCIKTYTYTYTHIILTHIHTIYALVDFESAIYTVHGGAVGPWITATALTPHRCLNFLVPWCLTSNPCWMTWRQPVGFGVGSLGTNLDHQAKQSTLRSLMSKGIMRHNMSVQHRFHWVHLILPF